jgi:D-ornithine 4,5-aminomutase subunit alpha
LSREDDYAIRRQKFVELSDEQLKERFWELTGEVVKPLLELARTHTSPSIERSVLLRMGFSSIETQAIVQKCSEQNLLGKGAGHIVWRTAVLKNIPVREAGLALAEGKYWEEIQEFFGGGRKKSEL